ncbi:MAG: hypothetical protein QOH88_1745 [Verrucomicrobiota bacterium]|jgi:hypothetical protein
MDEKKTSRALANKCAAAIRVCDTAIRKDDESRAEHPGENRILEIGRWGRRWFGRNVSRPVFGISLRHKFVPLADN